MGRVNSTFSEPLAGEPFDLVWCSAVCLKRVTDQDQSQDHQQIYGVDKNLLMSLSTRDLATLRDWLTPAD
jgi:hypothetical protein